MRWRGSIIAVVCVAAFFAVFYGFYIRGYESTKPFLWVFGLGAIIGGAMSFLDSVGQFTRKSKSDKSDDGH
jgi:hypothetical protein